MNDSDNLRERLQSALGDGYHVERELTPGGMSRLFLATELSLNRAVVVKVLPPEAMDSVAEDRFRREAELLARLQHPHIVPVLSVGRTPDVAYYVMPFVEGESLAARLARDGPCDVARGVELIREIAGALGHAHSLGVVHRDVKPANILLAAGHAVVTDFGIARVDASLVTRLTSTGLGLGTIGYMAPEQIVGASEVDARADIFALGVVGYELLTGRSPFATSSEASILAPQMRAHPAHPTTIRASIPKDAGDALLKALAPDPDARFATMEEFRNALPTMSRKASRRFGKRHALVAGGATLVVASLLAILLPRRGNDNEPALLSRASPSQSQVQPQGSAPDRPIVSIVAVAPFDVMRGDLGVWREGMVDVLSRNLDGMGDLRAISPTTVLQSWRGRSDAASAARLGKAVHAQVVVYGVLRADGDSVRAVATLYDMAAGQSIGDVERRDAASRVDRLADSLTVEIVRALGGPRGGRGPHLGSVGTRSMPALKAFLQGEQYFRRSSYDSAQIFFRRATEIDTGFALAYHGQARAYGWIPDYPQLIVTERAAAAHNHGLSERDSLVIAIGAMGAEARAATEHVGASLAKAFRATRKALDRYPTDAELLYVYADVIFHNPLREIAPMSPREEIALFEKAIAADSGLGEAYTHAISLAILSRDTKRLDRYLAAVEGNSRISGLASWTPMVHWFVRSPGRTVEECQRWADTVRFTREYQRVFTLSAVARWVDSSGSTTRCVERLASKPPVADADGASMRARSVAARLLRSRGRLSRSAALDDGRVTVDAIADYVQLAVAGVFDPDSVSTLARSFATDSSPDAVGIRPILLPFWAWRRDTVSLAAALASERRGRDRYHGFSPEEMDRVYDSLRDALFAFARGDVVRAIRVIESAPYAPGRLEAVFRGALLPILYERVGRVREARALIDRPSFGASPLTAVLAESRIGRLSERLGDRERAAAAYSFVLDALREAEPSFAPITREAMDGLRRTGDTRARSLP